MAEWLGPITDDAPVVHGGVTREDVQGLLMAGVRLKCSDVLFQTGKNVLAFVDGRLTALTVNALQSDDMEMISKHLTSLASIQARINTGRDYDNAIDVPEKVGTGGARETIKHRFRVNLSSVAFDGGDGAQAVCRYINPEPPSLADVQLRNEEEIVRESTPAMRCVIFAGETGSGKTSTMAALGRRIVEEEVGIRGPFYTLESPIEYVFDGLSSKSVVVAQFQVGRHYEDWEAGVRGFLRKSPRFAIIGELRDFPTIDAAVELMNTGCPMFTTTHANDISLIFLRLALKYPGELQSNAFHKIVPATHMLVSQVLVDRIGGGRVCCREWLVIDDDLRDRVEAAGLKGHVAVLRDALKSGRGQSMLVTVKQRFHGGVISEDTAEMVLARYGYRGAAIREDVF